MKIDVVTIFPDYFQPLKLSLLGKASEAGIVNFEIHDLQSFLSKNALVKISFFTRIPNLMSGTLSANKGVKT